MVDYSSLSTEQRTHNFKVNLNPAKHHRVLLDFDVSKSTVGYGKLNPSIRYIDEPVTGSIRGKVTPFERLRTLYVVTSTDTVSTFANQQGEFLIHGIKPGECKLVIPTKGQHATKIIEGVQVVAGEAVDLGYIALDKFDIPHSMFGCTLDAYWNHLETKISDDGKFLILIVRTCKFDCNAQQLVGPYDCNTNGPAVELYIERSKIVSDTEIKLNNDVPFLDDPGGDKYPQDGSFLLYHYVADDQLSGRYIYPSGTITISSVSNGTVSGSFDAYLALPIIQPVWISGTFNNVPMNPAVVTSN